MALASGALCLAATLPVTMLPSRCCHLGPAEWLMIILPVVSRRSASGPLSVQANLPSAAALQV